MINEQRIPCPVCKTSISFDVTSLLMGVKFACHNCDAFVSLAKESIEETKHVIQKYEALKINSKSKPNRND